MGTLLTIICVLVVIGLCVLMARKVVGLVLSVVLGVVGVVVLIFLVTTVFGGDGSVSDGAWAPVQAVKDMFGWVL